MTSRLWSTNIQVHTPGNYRNDSLSTNMGSYYITACASRTLIFRLFRQNRYFVPTIVSENWHTNILVQLVAIFPRFVPKDFVRHILLCRAATRGNTQRAQIFAPEWRRGNSFGTNLGTITKMQFLYILFSGKIIGRRKYQNSRNSRIRNISTTFLYRF